MVVYRKPEFLRKIRELRTAQQKHLPLTELEEKLLYADDTINYNPISGPGHKDTSLILICENCGLAKWTYDKNSKTCCRQCANQYRAKNNPQKKTNRKNFIPKGEHELTKTCDRCGKKFKTSHSRINSGQSIYCGTECSNISKGFTPVWFQCANCKSLFRSTKQSNAVFCCEECKLYFDPMLYYTQKPRIVNQSDFTDHIINQQLHEHFADYPKARVSRLYRRQLFTYKKFIDPTIEITTSPLSKPVEVELFGAKSIPSDPDDPNSPKITTILSSDDPTIFKQFNHQNVPPSDNSEKSDKSENSETPKNLNNPDLTILQKSNHAPYKNSNSLNRVPQEEIPSLSTDPHFKHKKPQSFYDEIVRRCDEKAKNINKNIIDSTIESSTIPINTVPTIPNDISPTKTENTESNNNIITPIFDDDELLTYYPNINDINQIKKPIISWYINPQKIPLMEKIDLLMTTNDITLETLSKHIPDIEDIIATQNHRPVFFEPTENNGTINTQTDPNEPLNISQYYYTIYYTTKNETYIDPIIPIDLYNSNQYNSDMY